MTEEEYNLIVMMKEFKELCEKTDKFCKEYNTLRIKYTKLKEIGNPTYDGHFACCCWANPNCFEGPDTCRCSFYHRLPSDIMEEIGRLIGKIYILENAKDKYNKMDIQV